MVKYLLLTLSVLIFSLQGFSQTEQWTIYTPDNSGLPSDQIRNLTFDNNGDLVVATNLGIRKFDGTNWTAYDGNGTGLPSNNIREIAVDPDGNIWVATASGLGVYNGTTWTTYNEFNSPLPDNSIRSMALDSNGNAWIGASNFNGTSGGLAHFDGTNWTIYDTDNSDLPNNYVRSIAIDENDDLWLGSNSGLAFFDGTDFTIYNTSNSDLPSNQVRALAVDSDGLWMRSEGLTFFDGTNWTNYNENNSLLPENEIMEIAIDSFGGLWMGLFSEGLVYFDGTNWTHYTDTNSELPYNLVRAVNVSENDVKWVGGTINGLAKLETCTFQVDQIDVTNPTCLGDEDGSITVSATGGTEPYTFNWVDGPQDSDTYNNVGAGEYTVNISEVGGCELQVNVTVEEGADVEVTLDATSPLCFGESNGTITATATGGAEPYTFNWTDGPDNAATYSDLAAGDYTVIVTDGNGCEAEATATLTAPTELTAQIESSTDETCAGLENGSITVTASGGTGAHLFSLNGDTPQTSGIFNGLAAGNYTITVTDDNNCETEVTAEIAAGAEIEVTLEATDPLCFGDSNGSITIIVTGGQEPYTFDLTGAPEGFPPYTDLSAGVYTIGVSDAIGCAAQATATLNEPEELTAQVESTTDVACASENDGSITVTAIGGTGDHSFSLNGETPQASGTFSGLAAGNYTITVTDENGCETEVTADIAGGTELDITFESTSPLCSGESNGTITATATGGAEPYTFNWTDGPDDSATYSDLAAGDYTVNITDNNGCEAEATVTLTEPEELSVQIESSTDVTCAGFDDGGITVSANGGTGAQLFSLNGDTPQTSGIFNGLAAGNYTITVTDANGCEAEVTAEIAAGAVVELTLDATDPLCFGESNGAITAIATGGQAPYTFNDTDVSDDAVTYSDLGDDTYTITVTDSNECEAEATATLTEPEELTAQIESSNDVTCAGDSDGSVTVTASGGTGAHLFSLDGGTPQTNGTFEGLSAGDYTVTVTDENGCEADVEVVIDEPEAEEADFDFTSDQGEVTFTNNSSEGDYLWDFGDGNTSDDENPVHSYAESGTYQVCLTLTTDCGEFTTCLDVEVIIISVEEGEAIAVRVYPNPASEKLIFEVSKGEARTIEFRDTQGRLLTTQLVDSQKTSINISSHSSGVYFYRILSQTGEVVKRGRVVVE
ncbi:two-component regulator propeller domain-containing protein [Halocola ammonii]